MDHLIFLAAVESNLGPTLLSQLVTILLVVVVARIAAELAERFGQPAVLAEIGAGILLGPSLLGWVAPSESLHLLAEIGAILLLFEVGLHMDLDDLMGVGGDASKVALVGVLAPALAAYPIAIGFGIENSPAIFLAAAVTATSVGITARVFADMKVLATSEARTVLGAAVVDDVLGLLILTFVTQTLGDTEATRPIGVTIALALGFVILGGIAAVMAAPAYFQKITKFAKTDGSLVVGTFAFALGVATLGTWAGLAPLVGGFIAGVAAARSDRHSEFQRRIAPVGQIIIPIFFVSVGLEVDVTVFTDMSAVSLALALSAAGIVTKVIGGFVMKRSKGDRLLVGMGMVPRGEVGLIFATLGLSSGILDTKTHAALVLVVLITTVLTPPALRWRLKTRPAGDSMTPQKEPDSGYLDRSGRAVELAAIPSPEDSLNVILSASAAAAQLRPGTTLIQWLTSEPLSKVEWDSDTRTKLYELLRHGNDRSYRLLESTGVFAEIFPRIAAEPRHATDPFGLDPSTEATWDPLLDLLTLVDDPSDRGAELFSAHENQNLILLAALAKGAFQGNEAATRASEWVTGLGVPYEQAAFVSELVEDRRLFPAAAIAPDMGKEDQVLELAAHLKTDRLTSALYVLAAAEMRLDRGARARLDELFELVRKALAHAGGSAATGGGDVLATRRAAVASVINDIPSEIVAKHLEGAPRRYLLAHGPSTIALHLHLIDPIPAPNEVAFKVDPEAQERFRVHVAIKDKTGTLASISRHLTESGYSIVEASASVWSSGAAILVFLLKGKAPPSEEALRELLVTAIADTATQEMGRVEGMISLDNNASPWHSILEVRASERQGLLAQISNAISSIEGQIVHANITTQDGIATDRFFIVNADGKKLGSKDERLLKSILAGEKPGRLSKR